MSAPLHCRNLNVVHTDDGWIVQCARGAMLAGPLTPNGEAWRALDRLERQPISPAEDKVDWMWSVLTGGGNL